MYVFDTSPISELFRSYYQSRFPTLWENFDDLIDGGAIVSTREVRRELEDRLLDPLKDWLDANSDVFATPTAEEAEFVTAIYSVRHFQQNIEQQKILRGGKNADPFVIAKAAIEKRTVVTLEGRKPHSVKIPNICDHFGIECLDLEGFMEREGWTF